MTMFDTPELSMLGDAAERFAADNADATDADRLWRQFAGMGWLGLGVPEENGGPGLGACAVATVTEAMGRRAMASPYLAGSVVAGGLLSRGGRDAGSRDADMAALAAGDLRVAVDAALLAPGANGRLAARLEKDTVSLSGAALAIGWAQPDAVLAGAADADGRSLLLRLPASGLACEPARLATGGAAARLALDGATFPADCVVARGDACDAIVGAMQGEALLAAAAENLGAMQALFDRTLDYVKLRRQFGRAIGSFQALQFRLTDMWIRLDEARSLVIAAAVALDAGDADAARLVRAAWVQSLWSGRLIGEEAVQMHGAIGMTEECAVGRFVRQLLVNELLFGTEETHLARYRPRTRADGREAAPSATA